MFLVSSSWTFLCFIAQGLSRFKHRYWKVRIGLFVFHTWTLSGGIPSKLWGGTPSFEIPLTPRKNWLMIQVDDHLKFLVSWSLVPSQKNKFSSHCQGIPICSWCTKYSTSWCCTYPIQWSSIVFPTDYLKFCPSTISGQIIWSPTETRILNVVLTILQSQRNPSAILVDVEKQHSYTLWQTNIAGWNIPMFNRKYIDSIRGPHFPAFAMLDPSYRTAQEYSCCDHWHLHCFSDIVDFPRKTQQVYFWFWFLLSVSTPKFHLESFLLP